MRLLFLLCILMLGFTRPLAANDDPGTISQGERIELSELGFSIVPPAGWMVKRNSYGSTLLFEAPKVPNQLYQATIQVMVFGNPRYIDNVTMKEFGELIVGKFGALSNRVSGYHLRDNSFLQMETGDQAILYYTEFQYDNVPIMQMHILISSATNHFLLSYTDLSKSFEDENSLALTTAYKSMHSAQLSTKPVWPFLHYVIVAGVVVFFILVWSIIRMIRSRRMSNLGQRLEDEEIKEHQADEESHFFSRHTSGTGVEQTGGLDDDWSTPKSNVKSAAPQKVVKSPVKAKQQTEFDDDDEMELSDVVPISTLDKSLHPGRKIKKDSTVIPTSLSNNPSRPIFEVPAASAIPQQQAHVPPIPVMQYPAVPEPAQANAGPPMPPPPQQQATQNSIPIPPSSKPFPNQVGSNQLPQVPVMQTSKVKASAQQPNSGQAPSIEVSTPVMVPVAAELAAKSMAPAMPEELESIDSNPTTSPGWSNQSMTMERSQAPSPQRNRSAMNDPHDDYTTDMTEEARLSEILPKAGTIEKSRPKRKGLFWRKKEDDQDEDDRSQEQGQWDRESTKKSGPKKPEKDDDDDGDSADQWVVEPYKKSNPSQVVAKGEDRDDPDDPEDKSEAWGTETAKRSEPNRQSLLNETQIPRRLIGRAGPLPAVTKNELLTKDGWNLNDAASSDHDDEEEEGTA
jgi:hypothetical protein